MKSLEREAKMKKKNSKETVEEAFISFTFENIRMVIKEIVNYHGKNKDKRK